MYYDFIFVYSNINFYITSYFNLKKVERSVYLILSLVHQLTNIIHQNFNEMTSLSINQDLICQPCLLFKKYKIIIYPYYLINYLFFL